MNGWIRLHRKIVDDPIFKNKDAYYLASYLLLMVNHKPGIAFPHNTRVEVKRGQFIVGEDELARIVQCSPSKARRLLLFLESEGFLKREPKNRFTLITIINYNKYQSDIDEMKNQKRTGKEQEKTNNNDKNIKNSTVGEVKALPLGKVPLTSKQVLIEFKRQYREYSGDEYIIQWGKDMKQWGNLAKEYPIEDPAALITKFFEWHKKDIFWCNKPPEFGMMIGNINKVIAFKSAPETKPFEYKEFPICISKK